MPQAQRYFTIAVSASILSLASCREATTPSSYQQEDNEPIPTASFNGPELFPHDLGTLGGAWSIPTDLNDRGTVVGRSLNQDGITRAFRWSNHAGMTDLGVLPGDFWSAAIAITNDGRIFGVSGGGGGGYDDATIVVWDASGKIRPLGVPLLPGATLSIPTDANASGQVVGWSDIDMGRGWIWSDPRGIYDLGTGVNTDETFPTGITDNGLVVGQSYFFGSGLHAFKWTLTSGMVDLGVGDRAVAYQANNRGTIVGSWEGSEVILRRPRVWSASGTRPLPAPDGGEGEILAINALEDGAGYISGGQAGTSQPQAAIWWNPMQSGPRLLGPTDPYGSYAVAINRQRLVVGTSPSVSGGATHAVLWRPALSGQEIAGVPVAPVKAAVPAKALSGPAGCLADPRMVSNGLLTSCILNFRGTR
jgi:probable HAF family extracellular repeat protein